MQYFTPLRLLCYIGLHDWIYGFDTDKNTCIKKCSRCNKEETVDIKEVAKKAPDIYKQFEAYEKIKGIVK